MSRRPVPFDETRQCPRCGGSSTQAPVWGDLNRETQERPLVHLRRHCDCCGLDWCEELPPWSKLEDPQVCDGCVASKPRFHAL